MLFPCEIKLRTTETGPRIIATPVKEVELLHEERFSWENLVGSGELLSGLRGELWHIKAEFDVQNTSEFGLEIQGISLKYDVKTAQLHYGNLSALLSPDNHIIKLEILVDRVTIEVFANDGRLYMPLRKIRNENQQPLALSGNPKINSLEVFAVDSVWE